MPVSKKSTRKSPKKTVSKLTKKPMSRASKAAAISGGLGLAGLAAYLAYRNKHKLIKGNIGIRKNSNPV